MLIRKLNYSRYLEFILALALLLYWGRSLFIPLSFAWLLSILLYPLCKKLETKGLSRSISIALSLCVMVLMVAGLIFLAIWQLSRLKGQLPSMAAKFSLLLQQFQKWVLDTLHISLDQQISFLHVLKEDNFMSGTTAKMDYSRSFLGITYDKVSFHTQEDEQIERGILAFSQANKADLIVMVNHERSFWQSIFNSSHTKEMAYHTTIPLLAIHD